MCYCKNGEETLGAAIEGNTAKVPQVQSEIEEAEAEETEDKPSRAQQQKQK